jgi:hypothetical protein
MVNPFEKRATEYLREDEAFLAIVTPEPLETFFEKPAKEGRLYDRLSLIIGSPGSGKTTLARLFQYSTLQTLLKNRDLGTYKPLVDTLVKCQAITDSQPKFVGCRLPLESEYRDFWEFPYPEEVKAGLMTALLQSRAVLSWCRNLVSGGVSERQIQIVPRRDSEAALVAIGGPDIASILDKARQIELAVYKISAALLPPKLEDINAEAAAAYRPFDVIESIRVSGGTFDLELKPLVIFDDAHSLHKSQFTYLQRWLARRELKLARWILTRYDALSPEDVLTEERTSIQSDEPGLKRSREITEIWLQSSDDRTSQRRAFRKMAKDMANRYLRQMDIFNRRGLHSLGDLLSINPEVIPASKLEQLSKQVDSAQKRHSVSPARRSDIESEVDRYLSSAQSQDTGWDVRLSMVMILLERYAKRIPQRGLFEQVDDLEPSRPLTADSGVASGARTHLLHKFNRPHFFGIDALCDASSENAEQFLQLASRLVSQIETQLIRGKQPMLSSGSQDKLLREKANEMMRDWDFPHYKLVRKLADHIACECVEKSLEPNASLGGGASAVGIPQEEFDLIPTKYPLLAQVIQYGVAYNAFSLVQNHMTKKRPWCLLVLGGVLLLSHGLTLQRGGFLERKAEDLNVQVCEVNS